jgi:hypothetical protein
LIGVYAWLVVRPAAANPYTNGFATLYTESRILIEHPRDLQRLYDDDWFQQQIDRFLGRHVQDIAQGQPPTMSLMLAPVAWLGPARARLVWILLSALFCVAGLAVLASGLGIRSLYGVPAFVWLTAAATPYKPIADTLKRGQGYALMFLLLCLAVRSMLQPTRRRGWIGGACLGLIFALKSAGLWLYPLLAAAKKWRVLLGAAAALAAAVLAGAALAGWKIWPIYAGRALHWVATEPSNHVTAYQTVPSLAGHLFAFHPIWNPTPVAHLPVLAMALPLLVMGIVFGISVRRQRLSSGSLDERALTLGMFVAPLVAMAPIGEGYHYVMISPAVLIGWWWALRTDAPKRAWLLMAACTALVCAPQRYYSSEHLRAGWLALLAYPRAYGALMLWGVLARALRSSSAAAPSHDEQATHIIDAMSHDPHPPNATPTTKIKLAFFIARPPR